MYLKKMRRWICCGRISRGDSDLSNDEQHLKTQWQQQPDGLSFGAQYTLEVTIQVSKLILIKIISSYRSLICCC